MENFAVFAHDAYFGTWAADTAGAACQAAADEVGTEGNTDGMTAIPVSECDPEWLA